MKHRIVAWTITRLGLQNQFIDIDTPILIEREHLPYEISVREIVRRLISQKDLTFAELMTLAAIHGLPSDSEIEPCPRCNSKLSFSRSNGPGIDPAPDVAPAPYCETCGYNGRFVQFSTRFEKLIDSKDERGVKVLLSEYDVEMRANAS